MNKVSLFTLVAALLLAAAPCPAQDDLNAALPLLQKTNRTAAENARVLRLFRSAKTPDLVFAAGASLVKTPPSAQQLPALFNLVLKNDDALKQVFAAVIITAAGSNYQEFIPLLTEAAQSQDNALRSYAACALAVLNPQDDAYSDSVVNLYIYDESFAQRAMNLLADSPKRQFKYLKRAAASSDERVRAAAAAWLGDLQTQQAAKELLSMAKKEATQQAGSAIAAALAENKQYTLSAAAKELKRDYRSPQSATYALALGFMTGSAVDAVKNGLNAKNLNTRINSARAAAYMAGVLNSPDAERYTNDKNFDILLLKGLITPLNELSATDAAAQIYADNALQQISKLKR